MENTNVYGKVENTMKNRMENTSVYGKHECLWKSGLPRVTCDRKKQLKVSYCGKKGCSEAPGGNNELRKRVAMDIKGTQSRKVSKTSCRGKRGLPRE